MVSLYLWFACPKPIVIPPPPKISLASPITDIAPQRTHIMMAWYQTYTNKWEQAQEHFRSAHDLAPEDPWIYISWGDAADVIGDGTQAVWAWEKALEMIPPTDVYIRNSLYQKIESY